MVVNLRKIRRRRVEEAEEGNMEEMEDGVEEERNVRNRAKEIVKDSKVQTIVYALKVLRTRSYDMTDYAGETVSPYPNFEEKISSLHQECLCYI